jgi:hypothetical protein
MLLKHFLNEKELKELLDWAITLNYYHKANGKDVFNYYLTNPYLPLLNNIIEKVSLVYKEKYDGYKIKYNESCILKINPSGWINIHIDTNDKEVKNFNIVLSKPKDSGFILHGDKKVILENGDAYLLDATIPHGISTVKEDNLYQILLYYAKY